MRIAMVSEHASPLAALGGVDAGGQNVHVAALATALAGLGHSVEVYTRRDDAGLPERVRMAPGVDVVHVPAGPARHVPKDELLPWMADFGRWLADAWLADTVPDVVHGHFWMSGLAALQASRAVASLAGERVPVVQTFHALGSVKRRHQGDRDTSPRGRVQTEAALGRSVDLVIATCSDEVAELRRLGVPDHKVGVVPCGVDLEHFTPRRAGGRGVRGPGGAPSASGRPYVLSIGRLVERKGVDTVIQALVDLPDVELRVAGGPPADELADDPEVQRLSALARRLRVADRVTFLGCVAHDDVPGVIQGAEVVVATPWYEPFGIVPLEAAACGTPVVGSAVGGLLDSVQDGVTGYLVPPQDPGAVADAVRTLLDDPVRRRRFGVAARRRAEQLYGWDSVARETARAYEHVVGAEGAARGTLHADAEVEAV
ncbi:glycosyltransferase [Actinotalea ferrariae]|uniref:glycosyltransferase n=1 Tax=Actinotalea ferrariae TaxID=1386098 RepID=UPI001C8C4BC9|nr:glycosyltransferase [Actinotalea ferrariae]MBX9247101.1 glycosyltransferase [Actinotalea ferrariae]